MKELLFALCLNSKLILLLPSFVVKELLFALRLNSKLILFPPSFVIFPVHALSSLCVPPFPVAVVQVLSGLCVPLLPVVVVDVVSGRSVSPFHVVVVHVVARASIRFICQLYYVQASSLKDSAVIAHLEHHRNPMNAIIHTTHCQTYKMKPVQLNHIPATMHK